MKDTTDQAKMAKTEGEKQKKEKMQKKRKKEFGKLTIEEEIEIARMIEEKQEEKEDLIEIRTVEEIVPRRFHKYSKVFENKELERMLARETWDHAIDLREGFVSKKKMIYPLSRIERDEVQKFLRDQLRKRYIQPSKSPQTLPVFFVLKKDGKKRII